MTHYYLRTAWRNLKKNSGNGLINVLGLSIGMAASLLIFMWVHNESHFDDYHPGADRIYHVKMGSKADHQTYFGTPWPLSDAMKQQIPEIEAISRLMVPSERSLPLLTIQHHTFREKQLAYVDPSWFQLFHYEFIEGNANSLNNQDVGLILSQTMAKKLFGESPALGKTIQVDSNLFQVKAIVRDNPVNTSFPFEIFLPLEDYLKTPRLQNDIGWMSFTFQTFVRLKQGVSTSLVEKKIDNIIDNQETLKMISRSQGPKAGIVAGLGSLKDLHFDDSFGKNYFRQGNKKVVLIFSLIGSLLMIIACINYINLVTARTNQRGLEISIKKVLGARKNSLFTELMAESILTALLSFVLSILLIELTLPWFNRFTERNFSLYSPYNGILLIFICIGTILLTGIYPSLLLSSFKPRLALKARGHSKNYSPALRKGMVTFQFTVSIALTITAIVIFQQLRYIQENQEGYDRSQLFSFSLPKDWTMNHPNMQKSDLVNDIKNDLYKYPIIRQVTVSIASPFNVPLSMGGMADWVGKDPKDQTSITPIAVDTDYRSIFHLELDQGRWFGFSAMQDHHNYILNESAVAAFHLNKPFIGQYFSLMGDSGQIVGIVKDFHFRDFRQKIGPVVFYNKPEDAGAFFVQARGADMAKAITKVGQTWSVFFPSEPFEYHFLDEEFAKLYSDDTRVSLLIGIFSAIAILISCLGLFGLVSYMAEQRTREIGIRKVLGASVTRIAIMLSAGYFWLIIIALLIASPIAIWYMNKWLEGFVYRIDIHWWLIPLAGLLTLFIALGTMSFQCIKAAMMNPVKNLRNE